MPTIKEKRELRAKHIADARAIHTKAAGEKRDMTAAENEQFDKLMQQQEALKTEIEAEERAAGRMAGLDAAEAELEESAGRQTPARRPGEDRGRGGRADAEDATKPITFEVRGRQYTAIAGTPMHNRCRAAEEFRGYLQRGETRDLQMDLQTSGGYIVTPESMVAELIKNVDNATPFRDKIRKFTVVDAASLGAATLTDRISSRTRGSELGQPTTDTNLKFGKRSLTPSPTTGLIKVSRDLMRSAVMSPESIVLAEIQYEEAIGLEQEYMTGSGANAPLGVFTAHADGIPTSRDVSTGNTATAITFDGLISAKMALKQAYRNRANWLFHRDAVTQIMKIKDGQGQYIWQQSVQAGTPDRILNVPVLESEYAPSTFTTGLYVGLIGDFDWYWHVDQLALEIQRLMELYAATNQVGFMYRAKNDAAPMKSEAFARVKLG